MKFSSLRKIFRTFGHAILVVSAAIAVPSSGKTPPNSISGTQAPPIQIAQSAQTPDQTPKSATAERQSPSRSGPDINRKIDWDAVWDAVIVWSVILTIMVLGGLAGIYPIVFYVNQVWRSRQRTIFETLNIGAKSSYLNIYHPSEITNIANNQSIESDFNNVYTHWFGRDRLLKPAWIVSLFIIAYLFLCSTKAVKALFPDSPAALTIPLQVNMIAIAAMAGAYVLVSIDTIARVTRRDLLPEDLYLTALRLAACVPLGYAFGSLVSDSATAPFIALALTAFPLQQLVTFLQQIGARQLGVTIQVQQSSPDSPIQLAGIEQTVCARLGAIGMNTISQVAYADPVQLTMRTSLNFVYVLDIVSQALAWIYLEQKLAIIRPMGLRGAFEMKSLYSSFSNGDHNSILLMAELPNALGMTAAQTENMLREVINDPRVSFLHDAFDT
jgi:hypothetical protein